MDNKTRTKRLPALLAALALLLLCAEPALAHRVNVFAFVDGDAIQVECSFGKSQPVRNGKLLISDLESGAVLLEAGTDEAGRFRFRPPEAVLQGGRGLNIRLLAGEGHQDDWQVLPDELVALKRTAEPQTAGPELAPPAPAPRPEQSAGRQPERGPGLRDIVGGLGWIAGLLGLATYIKYRRKI